MCKCKFPKELSMNQGRLQGQTAYRDSFDGKQPVSETHCQRCLRPIYKHDNKNPETNYQAEYKPKDSE
jgi:hypothetical protein